jgi:sulfate permease, SulP family
VPRLLPILEWLPHYQRHWLRPDVLAGLTVTAILIPEGMAYAQLAGVGPEAAFYAAPIGLLLYALLGSSRQLVVAVSSAVAITSAATVSALAPQGSSDYVALTAALAILAGLLSVIAGLLKLGRIANFFSSSVLLGFVFGLALIITMKQIPKLLGVEVSEQNFFVGLYKTVLHLGDTHLVTLAVGVGSIALMLLVQRFMPKLPAALLVLIVAIAVSAWLDLPSHGVAVVGHLPSGLAAPQFPGVGLSAISELFVGAMGIALLAFAEATGPAQQFAKEHGYEIDANQELIAIGAANMGAGLFRGFPIGASLSKSAANDRTGARTPLSLLVASAATVLVALFLTPLFEDLPEAALGAIVVVAVSGMERIAPLQRLWRLHRVDFLLAVFALLAVLVFPILVGLALAVMASLAVIVWRSAEARLELNGKTQGKSGGAHIDHAMPSAGLLVARPEQMVFFVNATEIRSAITDAVARNDPRPDVVLLDLALTPDIDVPTADALTELDERLTTSGVELWLAGVMPPMRARLDAADLTRTIGADHLFQDTIGGILGYVNLHSESGVSAQRHVLPGVVDFIRTREQQPGLDQRGRETLEALVERIQRELDQLD